MVVLNVENYIIRFKIVCYGMWNKLRNAKGKRVILKKIKDFKKVMLAVRGDINKEEE